MFITIESTIMLILLLSIVIFMMFKLVNINKFNLLIYSCLLGFWISSYLLKTSMINIENNSWKWPILLGSFQLTQAVFRFPLGKWSQKIKSRKIPILLTILIMIIFSIPLIIKIDYYSLLLATIGLGFFASTFGMQNQYWGENWNIREIFITSGLILLMPYIGKFISLIIISQVNIDSINYKYLMFSFFIIISFVSICYLSLKEKKETILLDNISLEGKEISKLGLKNILILSLMISCVSFSINLVNNRLLINFQNDLLLKATINSIYILVSLLVAFILIKFVSIRLINNISYSFIILGFLIMIFFNFIIKSYYLSSIGFFIALIGYSAYAMSLFGTMLHFDHKNSFLVLSIWLTIKSLSTGISQIINQEITIYYEESFKYILFFALFIIIISLCFSNIVYKKYTKKIFNIVENIEQNCKTNKYYK